MDAQPEATTDRLAEIEHLYDHLMGPPSDVVWLIAEVKRLRIELMGRNIMLQLPPETGMYGRAA